MNKQKMRINPFKHKFDHKKNQSNINRINNNHNANNAIDRIIQKSSQKIHPLNVQPIFNYSTGLKSCLKIDNKSKGVQKSKSVKFKTPAQDRLKKIVKTDRTAVVKLLKDNVNVQSTVKSVVTKKNLPHGSVNSQKLNVIVNGINDVKSTAAVGIVSCAKPLEAAKFEWTNDFARNESVSKIGAVAFDAKKSALVPSFYIPETGLLSCQMESEPYIIKKGHDVQAQHRLKINDTSKIIGGNKFKSKTPAQDRLRKLVDKNRATLIESLKELVDINTILPATKSCRKSIGIQKSHITGIEPSIIDIVDKNGNANDCTIDAAYIIPDTNVFLNSLACIKNVIEKDLNSIIFVPFIVLQELDSLKQRGGEQNFTLKYNAKRTIRYIYELLTSDNKRLRGQSAIEDKSRLINTKSNDDHILNCCLQLVKKSKKVRLVTNDMNLTNIAKFSGIETMTLKRCLDEFQ